MLHPHRPDGHPDVTFGKIGVLFINLGTPDSPDTGAVRRYLRQFLSDTRVIETPKWIWWPILNGPILTFRPRKTARNYAKIWGDESPLRRGTREIRDAMTAQMGTDNIVFEYAMRYGAPSVASRMEVLQDQGCDKILCFALYPQYSATTTASAYDAAFEYALSARWQPALRTLPSYHDHPLYIEALKNSVQSALKGLDWEPDTVLASFHGLPKEYLTKGDPYHCHAQKTGRLLREALGWEEDKLQVTFQSRFGPLEWLQPYTDDVAAQLAESGQKKIAIISPCFATDCLETLEELAMGTQEIFTEAGGTNFHYIPCLNAEPDAIDLYRDLIEKNISGWT